MQRDRHLIALLTLVIALLASSEAKICEKMEIRSNITNLEKLRNCTEVMGYVRIHLLDMVEHESAFEDYTFPELLEIDEYLLLYSVKQLKSVGKLFPNLKIIRGSKLFYFDYALILHTMPHLTQVGLTNLSRIERGAVMIDKCEEICYVNTINWTAIGASEVKFTEYKECKESCPDNCENCWNNKECQRIDDKDNCHQECYGCTKPNSARHCYACKNYKIMNNGSLEECRRTCPNTLLMHNYSMTCMTREECTMLNAANSTWWNFRNNCVNACPVKYHPNKDKDPTDCKFCGEKCVIQCQGTVVKSKMAIEELARCTHIKGSLEIRVSNPSLEPLLERHLGNIREIDGTLKISRSALRSLSFLKRLQVIGGNQADNITTNTYALFINENQNLQKLWDPPPNFVISKGEVGIFYNSQLCITEVNQFLDTINIKGSNAFTEFSNGDKAACNWKKVNFTMTEINPTNVTITWYESDFQQDNDNSTIIGFTAYYMKADGGKNITAFDNKEVCGTEGWSSVFVRNLGTKTSLKIINLEAYKEYGFYVKSYSETSVSGKPSVQTTVFYFMTSSDDPTEPLDFTAETNSSNSIVLKWSPPVRANGNLSYYRLIQYLEPDYLPTVSYRNYCKHRHVLDDPLQQELTTQSTVPLDDNNCSCKPEYRIFQKEMMRFCSEDTYDESCKSYMYSASHELTKKTVMAKRESTVLTKNASSVTYKIFDTTNNTFQVNNLTHFTLYIFFLSACNLNSSGFEQCGPIVMTSQRTEKSHSADYVLKLRVEIDGNRAELGWDHSNLSNSFIVAYNIEMKRMDLEYAVPEVKCITREQFEAARYVYKTPQLSPGKYSIRVQVVSLSGPGLFSSRTDFIVVAPNNEVGTLIGVLVGLLIILVVSLFVFRYFWKKRHAVDNIHLITSINPEYAGLVYVEDEWEIERDDILQLDTIGKGSFGMVYEGRIKSRNNYPCAIKTVNENASTVTRLEFLSEGSRMKSFNDAHHVVRLLGIVSRGQPPLVIMELMERGDLKSYLKRCREPSQNLTTNELYRMAAEIADGMAYLAAKKFVHRDLAARNCMVSGDRTVKIGDFGMARDIYETDYYRKETVGLLPVRWMAPESLADGVFTSDSDCWSYGIVLWEMATLGQQPYQGLSNEEVFNFVKSRGTLERPPECSDLCYEVMSACWAWRPNDRPTFKHIVDRFVNHVGEGFRLVAFCYSRQGEEHYMNAGPRPFNPPALVPVPQNEDEFYSHYDVAEEQVGLCLGESSRPRLIPFSSQRHRQPYHVSPGSPDSEVFSLNTPE